MLLLLGQQRQVGAPVATRAKNPVTAAGGTSRTAGASAAAVAEKPAAAPVGGLGQQWLS